MQIDKLKIKEYKNLVNCEFDFSNSNGLSVVAGINGSGKSNLLEAILLIMQDFRGMPKPINREWPLYEISFTQGEESLSVSRDQASYEMPQMTRLPIGNVVDQAYNIEFSVIYMYSGDFNRLLTSNMEYSNGLASSTGFYSIVADDLKVAIIVLALENLHQAGNNTSQLIEIPKVAEINYRIIRNIHIDETGPEDEAEALLIWMSQQSGVDGRYSISLNLLSEELANIGVVAPRDKYYILSTLLEDKGDAIVSDIDVIINRSEGESISVEDLSEGEKRLLLLRFIYDALGCENSLILLDEPDAHVHEGRKIDLYHYLEKHSGNGICTICTSHSPSIVNAVKENSLIGLRLDDSRDVKIVEKDAISTFRDIADERMGYFSTKPIVLFEGKIDVAYVSSALKYFNREDVLGGLEFLSCGGAGEIEGVYRKLRAIFPNRQFRVYCDRDSGGLVAMKALSKMFGVVSYDEHNEEGCPQWNNCSEIPAEIISKLEEKDVFFLPHPFEKCSDYAIEDYFSRDFLIETLEEKLQEQNGHMSLKSFDSIGEQVKKRLYAGVTTIPDSEKHRFSPIVRSVVEFYNKAYRNESIDISFIVPVSKPIDEEDVNRQLGSLERAIENLVGTNKKCATEILAVNTLSDLESSVLGKYTNVIDCPNSNLEKAIFEGVRNAKGDYVVLVWQKSLIKESLLNGISNGLDYSPDFMLLDLNCECQDGEFFDLTNECQARKAFAMLNKEIPVTSFCISRRVLLSLCKYDNYAGVLSNRIGLYMLFNGKSFWSQTRSVSKWQGAPGELPSVPSNLETDSYIRTKFNRWAHRENESSLFF